VTAQKTIQSI